MPNGRDGAAATITRPELSALLFSRICAFVQARLGQLDLTPELAAGVPSSAAVGHAHFAKPGRDNLMARKMSELLSEEAAGTDPGATGRRDRLQALLAPYMSRMEREPTSDDSARTIPLNASLDAADMRAFGHLATSFKPEHAWAALPYWLSVPLPAQSLGSRYQAWDHATIHRDGSLAKLTLERRNSYSLPKIWPHPKLRALEEVTQSETLALPWVRPSAPWWPLRGAWAAATHDPKLLVFSRFKSTPQSVAALTSLRVEARFLSRTGRYEKVWKRRRLQAGRGRLPTLALFHPSPFLIRATDPLASKSLLNDWSARDIQAWEYRPLGPFQGKASAASISPWIVTREALEPFKVSTPDRERPLLPYLREPGPMLYDIGWEVTLVPAGATRATVISRTNYREMYYSAPQMLAHHAIAGCGMRTGDLLGCACRKSNPDIPVM